MEELHRKVISPFSVHDSTLPLFFHCTERVNNRPPLFFFSKVPLNDGDPHSVTRAMMKGTRVVRIHHLVSKVTATVRQWGSSPSALWSPASTLIWWTMTQIWMTKPPRASPRRAGEEAPGPVLIKVNKHSETRQHAASFMIGYIFLHKIGLKYFLNPNVFFTTVSKKPSDVQS